MAEYILSHTGEEIDALFGENCTRFGNSPHAEGGETEASADYAHAEGYKTRASNAKAHAEGDQCVASGDSSHAEGDETIADGKQAHAEGHLTQALGSSSHAEGKNTQAIGYHSHAEGELSMATGNNSHAEGQNTKALGFGTHTEGQNTEALGMFSHAEGDGSTAGDSEDDFAGYASHAEGYHTKAFGMSSHAEGNGTKAVGEASHAEGHGTIANNKGEHACGKYNVSSQGDNAADRTIFSIGIGDGSTRKNGLEVRENGDVYFWSDDSYVRLQDGVQKMNFVEISNNLTENLEAKGNEYYNLKYPISELNIHLPDTYSEVNGERFFIKTYLDTNPTVRFIPGGGYGGHVYAEDGTTIQPNRRHEFCVRRVSNYDWLMSVSLINTNVINTIKPSGNPQTISEDEDILDTTE